MKTNSETTNLSDEKEEEPNQDNNNIKRKESSNNNDNEVHNILEKDENNKIEIDDKPIINKKKKKKSFFHDTDITEDSIIYFSNKLKNINHEYKKVLYISIALYVFNIIIWALNIETFHNLFNLISTIIILVSVIYQAYIFKHNFESISKEIYNLTQKMIYIYSSVVILFLINMIYITFFKIIFILLNKDKNSNTQKSLLRDIGYTAILFIYAGLNFIVPIILLIKLISVKKGIKNLSAAKGEIYESVRIEDVQIINSIINKN